MKSFSFLALAAAATIFLAYFTSAAVGDDAPRAVLFCLFLAPLEAAAFFSLLTGDAFEVVGFLISITFKLRWINLE